MFSRLSGSSLFAGKTTERSEQNESDSDEQFEDSVWSPPTIDQVKVDQKIRVNSNLKTNQAT